MYYSLETTQKNDFKTDYINETKKKKRKCDSSSSRPNVGYEGETTRRLNVTSHRCRRDPSARAETGLTIAQHHGGAGAASSPLCEHQKFPFIFFNKNKRLFFKKILLKPIVPFSYTLLYIVAIHSLKRAISKKKKKSRERFGGNAYYNSRIIVLLLKSNEPYKFPFRLF